MTTLREILNDDVFKQVFKISDEEAKKSFIELLTLYEGFEEVHPNSNVAEKLNSEFESVQDFNQKVLQKIYQKIRPKKLDNAGLVERKDMQNPSDLINKISQFDLAVMLEKLGVFEERKPPILQNNVRIILNGATQLGCQQRIDSVKNFIDQGLIPQTAVIDLATGNRDLWPDGIGGNDSSNYQPDQMLTTLLAEKTAKSATEITQIIFDERAKLVGLTISTLSPDQKSDLRSNIIENLKSEFVKSNAEFVWPQESEMFFRLTRKNFSQMKVVTHGGAADQNQGRATGITGLRKVALDLIEEVKNGELNGDVNLAVIAGDGHALRFSAILSDEIAQAAKAENISVANKFSFYPAGPSFSKNSFVIAQNNSLQNVAQNLLNLIESSLGVINHEMTRRVEIKREEPSASMQTSTAQQVQKSSDQNLNR
ncbi:MAG: hypothetical protein EBS06_02335 [Proteobacteria bacterium]|nr:hypothetical protein [Pseudomonadota bacterium]